MASVVSGASKGIGLAFTRYLVSTAPRTVFAVSRSVTNELQTLIDETKKSTLGARLIHVPCDLNDDDSIFSAVQTIQQNLNNNQGVELLLNVAGILGDNSVQQPGPERSITVIQREWLRKSFEINLFGHVMLTQQLIPLLKRATSKISNNNNETINNNQAILSKVINLSARVGSIEDNRLGGWYSYRMSKAALNMFTKTLSIEMKRHNCVIASMHPGTTDTNLSKPFQKNVKPDKLFTPDYSVNMMMNVINQLQLSDTGKCFAYDGTTIPY